MLFCTSFSSDPISPKQHSRRHAEHDDFLPYASSLIATLKTERDLERSAHQQTRQKSESRIAVLEAQLASREAELEACVAYSDASFRSSDSSSSQHLSQRAIIAAAAVGTSSSASRISKVCETPDVLPRKSGSEYARPQSDTSRVHVRAFWRFPQMFLISDLTADQGSCQHQTVRWLRRRRRPSFRSHSIQSIIATFHTHPRRWRGQPCSQALRKFTHQSRSIPPTGVLVPGTRFPDTSIPLRISTALTLRFTFALDKPF